MDSEKVATELSQKNGTLVSIFTLGGYVRELAPIVEHMRTKLGINTDAHNVAHVMWPLVREDKITFKERKERGKSFLTHIRITERGVQTAQDLLGMNEGTSRITKAGARQTHAVGVDGTDFRNYSKTAEGGPIERRVEKETTLDHVPFVVLSDDEAARFRATVPSQPSLPAEETRSAGQNGHASTADAVAMATDVATAEAAAPAEVDTRAQSVEDTVARHGVKERIAAFPESYPQIAAVLAKRDKIDRYQRAAELLGDDEAEIAVQLLEKVKITPLEEEVIRLIG